MDQQFSLPTSDGKIIYGVFNQAGAVRSSRLLILSHGLTGRVREFIHVMTKRAFIAAGYDVVRFSYYSGEPKARSLRECTLSIHAKDLNIVVSHFRASYPKIFIAGHSYGGLTTLLANPDANAVSFWDATWTPGWYKEVIKVPELNCFAFNHGQENLIGRAMFEEAEYFSANPAYKEAQKFRAPAQVVLADGDEKHGRNREELFNALGGIKELKMVKNADHQFTNEDSVEQLIGHSLAWFEAFSR